MSLKPCNFILTEGGKSLSYDQARQYLLDNPDLWVSKPSSNKFTEKVASGFRALTNAMGRPVKLQFLSPEEAAKVVGESGVKKQIIGEMGAKGLKTVQDNLVVAKEMEAQGKPAKDIFLATGWQRDSGDKNKWKYETNYNWILRLFKNYDQALPLFQKGTTLGELFSLPAFEGVEPAFIKAYPQLKDLKIQVRDYVDGLSYNPFTETISIDSEIVGDKTYSINLVHEIQHAIQKIEGFARGGDPRAAFEDMQLYKDIAKDRFGEDSPEYRRIAESLDENPRGISRQEIYQRLAGEVEARNAARRVKMDVETRRKTMLSETEDVAEDSKIYLYDTYFMRTPEGDVLGFVQEQPDGSFKVFIDPKTTTPETPVHEIAGHILLPMLKKSNPELYARGEELIQGTDYLKNAKGDVEEALAQAIGEKAAKLKESPALLKWVKDFWQWVGDKLNLNVSPERLQQMTLDDFTKLLAGSVIMGEGVSKGGKSKIDSLIDEAQSLKKELNKPGNFGANKIVINALIDAYVGVLKAAKATGEFITYAQAMLRAVASLSDKYSEAELNEAAGAIAQARQKDISSRAVEKAVQSETPKETLKAEAIKEGATETEAQKLAESVVEAEPPKSKTRGWVQSIRDAKGLPKAFVDAVSGERTRYSVLPNDVAQSEAKAIVGEIGPDAAVEMYRDKSVPGGLRSIIGQVAIGEFNKQKRYEEAGDFAMEMAADATDAGRFVNGLQFIALMGPQGAVVTAKKMVGKSREVLEKRDAGKRAKVKKAVDKVNKEAAEQISQSFDVETGPPEPTKREHKLVTRERYLAAKKALKNKAFSGIPPELLEIAVYHIEEGAIQFEEFARRMIRDLGRKAKPYLNAAYNKAVEKAGVKGESQEAVREYFEKGLDKDITRIMRENKVRLSEVIKKHYTEQEEVKRTLAEKIVEATGLEAGEAKILSQKVQAEFDRVATAKKKEVLSKYFSRGKKDALKTIIELTNMQAFDDAEFVDVFGKAMGYPELTPKNIEDIVRLAEDIQKSTNGILERRKTTKLLDYMAELSPKDTWGLVKSIHYASILMGINTQERNAVSNTSNFFTATTIDALYLAYKSKSTKAVAQYYAYMGVGFARALADAENTLRTGESPIRDKAQISAILSRTKFKGGALNPLNYYKYVPRFMTAIDLLTFEPLRESLIWQQAVLNSTSLEEAYQKYGYSREKMAEWAAQAEQEGIDEGLTGTDLKSYIARRKYELLDSVRDPKMLDTAQQYAQAGTFNQKPRGTLGKVAGLVNQFNGQFKAAAFVFKFVNTITNVANMLIDTSVFGAIRAARGGSIFGGDQDLNDQQKFAQRARATIGTAAMVGAYLLSQQGADDDDEPVLEITANGYDDERKNEGLRSKTGGWQRYSFRVNGGTWISYQDTPLFLALAPIGVLRDMETYRKEDLTDAWYEKLGIWFGANITQMAKSSGYAETAYQWLDGIMEGKVLDKLGKEAVGVGYSLVPVLGTGFYNSTVEMVKDAYNQPKYDTKEHWYGHILRNTPIAGTLLNEKINALGEPVEVEANILWQSGENRPSNKYWDVLAKNRLSIMPPAKHNTTFFDGNTTREMTEDEFTKYLKIRGGRIKEMMDKMNVYEIKDQERFKSVMKTIQSNATELAKVEMMSNK
jgi:hypothetical protein